MTLAPEQLQLRGREAEKVLQRSPFREREGTVRVPDQAGRLPRPGAVPQEEDFLLSRRFDPIPVVCPVYANKCVSALKSL